MAKSIKRQKALLAGVVAGFAMISAIAAVAQRVVVVQGEKMFPESVTSTADGTLYTSSFTRSTIYRALPGAATAEPWITSGLGGTVLGVLADEHTGTLWACSNPGTQKDVLPTLMSFDLKSGAHKGSYPFPGGTGLCNDFAVGPDGALYVTDTNGGRILRLKKGANELEVWAKDARLLQADGIALGDASHVYVNTFGTSTFVRVMRKADATAGDVSVMETSSKIEHPDGMRAVGKNMFLMVEGTGKLDRVTIEGDKAKVDVIKDGYDGPTGVTVVGNTAWVLEAKLKYMRGTLVNTDPGPFKVYAVKWR